MFPWLFRRLGLQPHRLPSPFTIMAVVEEELVKAFTTFYGLKLFSAVSFIAVVYDHLITLDDEVDTIWKNRNVRWHSKAAFVVNRYLTESIIAYVVYILSGMSTTLSDTVCHRFIWIYGSTCVVAGAISHFVILVRVYALWDRRASVARVLISAFAVCITTTTVLGVLSAMEMEPNLHYFAPLRTCIFGSKPKVLVGMLGVLSFFDLSLVILVVSNAMERPRLTHIEIVSELQSDGVGFFLCIFVLRFADLMVSVFREPGEIFIAITTVWGFCTIINARLHMRLEGLSLSRSSGTVIMFEDM
ncbi:hypothetical protein C8R47DRAFT_1144032 [Mycena vitilis]|nr:hypothetical protein C8R47DRAFT_1144032 [Mycena vitilis]